MNSKASDGGRVEGEGVDVASNPSDPSKGVANDLAREIEAGGGTDEAVALALGWYPLNAGGEWCGPGHGGGYSMFGPPAFLTDLNALAAECERRQWDVSLHTDGGCSYARVTNCEGEVFDSGINDAPTLARALCAALIRAAGETR